MTTKCQRTKKRNKKVRVFTTRAFGFRFNGNREDCSFPILEHYMHARTKRARAHVSNN